MGARASGLSSASQIDPPIPVTKLAIYFCCGHHAMGSKLGLPAFPTYTR